MAVATLDWLDGPRLVQWLRTKGLTNIELQLGSDARAVRHWREGCAASVYTADKVLTRLSLHLTEVPEDLWVESPKAKESAGVSSRTTGATP